MQNRLHVFMRPSGVFPCLSRFRAPSFLFSLPHQPSATKDRGGGGTPLYALDRCVLLNRAWFTVSWVEWRCCTFYYPYQTSLAANQVVNRFKRESVERATSLQIFVLPSRVLSPPNSHRVFAPLHSPFPIKLNENLFLLTIICNCNCRTVE